MTLGHSSRNICLDRRRNISLSDLNSIEEETMSAELDNIYKALRLLPEFDGNPNVLTRFIHLCDQLATEFCTQKNSELCRSAFINGLLNKIVGPAARLINTNGIPNDWNAIRNALVNNFSDQRDETALYNDLALLTQGSCSAQEFYERCQNLFSTIMTYVSLHETVQTTISAKRDLYKRLTLQAYLRGLNDPLGSRIRCMRPETIEKALEFVHEEHNIIYMQNRNQRLPDKRMFPMHTPNFSDNAPKAISYGLSGPSRHQYSAPTPPQWKPNFYQPRNFGPTRTQQIFRAAPPNYNPNQGFRTPVRNPVPQNQQPRPMSGVSHYATRNLPPTSFLRGHDWTKSGNPPPSNYFKTREVNFNDCLGYEDPHDNYYDYYYPEYYACDDYDQYPEYYCTDYEPQPRNQLTEAVNDTTDKNCPQVQDFQEHQKSEKPT